MPAFFTQSCPTCGRRLHIDADHANQRVACQHCLGDFIACDPREPSCLRHDWRGAVLKRADELLALVAMRPEFA